MKRNNERQKIEQIKLSWLQSERTFDGQSHADFIRALPDASGWTLIYADWKGEETCSCY